MVAQDQTINGRNVNAKYAVTRLLLKLEVWALISGNSLRLSFHYVEFVQSLLNEDKFNLRLISEQESQHHPKQANIFLS